MVNAPILIDSSSDKQYIYLIIPEVQTTNLQGFFVILFLLVLLVLFAGCDTAVDKSVTADYNSTEPRGLETIVIPADSLVVSHTFRKGIGSSSYTLAGTYGDAEAFSVFKFSVGNINKDNIVDAYVVLEVDDTWESGDVEFDIYETHVDWADSVLIKSEDFLPSLTTPLSTCAVTDSSVVELTFPLSAELIQSWDDYGALLVKSSALGESMVSLLSDDTSYSPRLALVKEYSDGDIDTTGVYAFEGTYAVEVGGVTAPTVISEGGGNGFVMQVGLPASLPAHATVNSCEVVGRIPSKMITSTTLDIDVYRIEDAEFEDIDSVGLSSTDKYRVNVYDDTEDFTLDLTDIVNEWHIGGLGNFGLLFQPVNEGSSPSHCMMTFVDSIYFTYTPFPATATK